MPTVMGSPPSVAGVLAGVLSGVLAGVLAGVLLGVLAGVLAGTLEDVLLQAASENSMHPASSATRNFFMVEPP